MTNYRTPGMWLPPSVAITPFSRESSWIYAAGLASAAYSAANRAFYFPFYVTTPVRVLRGFWANGATVGTDSVDVGVYTSDTNGAPLTRLVSGGGTLSAGASACQFVNLTDTTLGAPGLYFLAIAMNGVTDTLQRSVSIPATAARSRAFMQETAYVLPSTATPVVTSVAYVPLFGISQRASI
jgi:hypothetical protein